jgi:tetratricopeptide (TPR) repeat protein
MIELLLQAEGALSVGLLDRAETLYRQVASADPRNSIAVVGLARVALERGGQPEALELARRALAIDPENVAAQRLVQRLEEVLAFQGVDTTPATGAAPAGASPAGAQPVGAPPEPEPSFETPPPASPPEPARRSFLDRVLRRR